MNLEKVDSELVDDVDWLDDSQPLNDDDDEEDDEEEDELDDDDEYEVGFILFKSLVGEQMKQIVMLNFVLVLIKHFDNGFINVLLKYLESIVGGAPKILCRFCVDSLRFAGTSC